MSDVSEHAVQNKVIKAYVDAVPHITVDSQISGTSENPVQNKVIYSNLQNKADKSPTLRQIHIGTSETPDPSLGNDGDIYIFKPIWGVDMVEENVDTVLNNISVLKKYRIPLEFTIRQPKILYAINSEKLDELLSIISINKDGNGMNFSIDYTYYILDELADIDIEKLIDTYNREFMNINSKTGLISLLKMANPNLGVFKINRETNLDILKKLGVENVDRIEAKYDYFVDLDNPLFTSMLNLFDKNDLVNKLNTDISVIPKI